MPCLAGEDRRWLKDLPLRFFEGDITEKESLPPFLRGCDAIVNIAGLTRAKSRKSFSKSTRKAR